MKINNLLIDLLYSQQQRQNDTTCILAAIQQTQLEYENHSIIDDIPAFDRTPD